MGYRHRWMRPAVIEQETFRAIVTDFRSLLPTLELRGVQLGNAFGEGKPRVDDDEVCFNGRARCRCKPKRAPGAQFLLDHAFAGARTPQEALARALKMDQTKLYDLDWENRRCGVGGCSYNTFHFERVVEGHREGSRVGDECKTNRRYYDLAVTCFLLIAKRYLGDRLTVYSDSRERWWDEPRELCQEVLGYGAGIRVGEPWEERRAAG